MEPSSVEDGNHEAAVHFVDLALASMEPSSVEDGNSAPHVNTLQQNLSFNGAVLS